MVGIHNGVYFHHVVQHVAAACNKEQECAPILFHQMVAPTVAILEQQLRQGTAVATHVQVRNRINYGNGP